MPKLTLTEAMTLRPAMEAACSRYKGDLYCSKADTEMGRLLKKADGRGIGFRAARRLRQSIGAGSLKALRIRQRADRALEEKRETVERYLGQQRPTGLDAQLAQMERRIKALEALVEQHDRNLADMEEGREEVAQIAEAIRLFAK